MTKSFKKQAVRFFSVLFIPALISCGSGGGGPNSDGETPPSSSLFNDTTPTPTSTGRPTAANDSTGTEPSPTTPNPVAQPVSSTTPTTPVPDNPPPPDPGGSSNEAAGWQSLGNRVNAAQSGKAVWLSLANGQSGPAVAWEEEGKIYTAFWNGARWNVEGPININADEAASLPSLASDGQALFMTWMEGRSLYLMRREGNGWAAVAVQTSQDGCGPANAELDIRQGVPIVAGDSFCSDSRYAATWVQQWAGAWVSLGGAGSHYADAPSPRKYALGADGQNLSLAVISENAAWDGVELTLFQRREEDWLPIGGPVNDPLSFLPSTTFSLAFVQNIPTLAFQQGGIQAKQWNGEAWVSLGTSLSQDGVDPALMEVNGSPTLAFSGSSVQVWNWNGAAWTQKGQDLNQTSGAFSWSTSLAASDQRLYAAWIENGFVFVKTLPIQ